MDQICKGFDWRTPCSKKGLAYVLLKSAMPHRAPGWGVTAAFCSVRGLFSRVADLFPMLGTKPQMRQRDQICMILFVLMVSGV